MIVDSGKLARRFRSLDIEEIGVHLLPGPEREAVVAACQQAQVRVVGLDALPGAIVTADAVLANGVVRPLKQEVDAAVPDAKTVLVIRIAGDVPLAPTLDAYLETEMIPGRDAWLEDLVPHR